MISNLKVDVPIIQPEKSILIVAYKILMDEML